MASSSGGAWHYRADCPVYGGAPSDARACSRCRCYLCDVPAGQCEEWAAGGDHTHFHARGDQEYWALLRQKRLAC